MDSGRTQGEAAGERKPPQGAAEQTKAEKDQE
jgi:hypothetical protein